MNLSRRRFTAAAVSLFAMAPLGCTTLSNKSSTNEPSLLDRLPWASKKASSEQPEPYPNPVKIAATWAPDTLVQTGRTPTRGFGGRVFFYDERSRPVPVEGTLVVHGFDDGIDDPEKSVRRFEFTPEQFTRHFSQTDLGASYSIWIPWDAVGGMQKRVSLVTSFRTTEGKLVQGIPATLVLPGATYESAEAEATAKFSPEYLRFREAAKSEGTRTSGLTTTTIRRRSSNRGKSDANLPGLNAPTLKQDATEIANTGVTPTFDLNMRNKPTRIMPASAQLPIQK